MLNREFLLLLVASSSFAQLNIPAPRIWNDHDLAEWATPVAALGTRPGHLSEKEYYAIPVAEWVRTYPVYFPGREPEGYWQMLQSKKPEPLIAPGARTEAAWIEAGRRAFRAFARPIRRLSRRSGPPGSTPNWEGTRRRTAPSSAGAGFLHQPGWPSPFPSVRGAIRESSPTAAGFMAVSPTMRAMICFLKSCNRQTSFFYREIRKPWRPGASLPFRGSPMTYMIGSRR